MRSCNHLGFEQTLMPSNHTWLSSVCPIAVNKQCYGVFGAISGCIDSLFSFFLFTTQNILLPVLVSVPNWSLWRFFFFFYFFFVLSYLESESLLDPQDCELLNPKFSGIIFRPCRATLRHSEFMPLNIKALRVLISKFAFPTAAGIAHKKASIHRIACSNFNSRPTTSLICLSLALSVFLLFPQHQNASKITIASS